ncbi:MAG: hypothetical protein M3317_07545, partial [Actinomycetota bacterium]|nr:hypothetical protein [Actinomycetota bacterium]
MSKKLGLVLVLAVALSLSLAASVAFAQGTGQKVFMADLNPLNRSGAHGHALLLKDGRKLDTKIVTRGMAPGLPHAQHIHGMAQAISECPTLAADKNGDGLINTAEGLPSYGPIQVSLTTRGDTSPASALAVNRFPVARYSVGLLRYDRTFSVPRKVARNLGKFAIVQHGVDLNHNGRYDFSAGPSELDPSLPQ